MTQDERFGDMKRARPSRRNADLADRQRQAVELRIAGLPFEAIADRLGYSDPSSAWKAVQRALVQTQRPATDELRELLTRRYEALLVAVWPKARAGDLDAVNTARRLLDSLTRLHIPMRVDVDPGGGASDVDTSIAALVAEVEARAVAAAGTPTRTAITAGDVSDAAADAGGTPIRGGGWPDDDTDGT